ncbi:hypothetical protein MVES1_001756 [Malassezia vespertilionis]|uniref:Cytochrome b5 heme-binding domain-containing protein n=1 Tax=Malassezia vespertilionis TaxID=2020962 RepID=A0A2N1JD54_9BASI|nr:uncharacterized protein MVES1_001756 [Malassezia vespertilionis]PKI84501.1 hypothetical protein MVES_001654 [Malassezia vespertilionis]WFD06411.1 hypothetical protein MVES1_001756 [Malassezia vespertilionis]
MSAQPNQKKEYKRVSRDEVAKHNKPDDLWIIVDSYVYDLSDFIDVHPGGEAVLQQPDIAGQDATETFFGLHNVAILQRPGTQKMIVGQIEGEESEVRYPQAGELSQVPYAEPTWLLPKYKSPYYNESHRRLQREMRTLVDKYVTPEAQVREADGKRPDPKLVQMFGKLGLNAMRLGPGKHLHGRKLFADIKPEEFDYFHEMIITQELTRCGYRGFMDGFNGGMVIGLPPILNFGSDDLKKEIVEPVLAGEKFISLAITEAFAGSDVMGLKTYAKKTEDGEHYIVNGTKKWITNGHFADYFTTAVRTDEGFGVILIPRALGVETRQLHTSYSTSAGTAFVMFNNIKVPSRYLVGVDGMGIPIVLSNFNHERWVMCCGVSRGSRAVCEVLFKWMMQRKVFGKPLSNQAVVRQKLGFLFAQNEACQAYLENITYQMNNMDYKDQAKHLAGQIALMKAWMTRVSHEVADNGVQIMGGRGLTKTGLGAPIEMYNRTYKFDAILGGTEEIMADLGVRQAIRAFPKDARL